MNTKLKLFAALMCMGALGWNGEVKAQSGMPAAAPATMEPPAVTRGGPTMTDRTVLLRNNHAYSLESVSTPTTNLVRLVLSFTNMSKTTVLAAISHVEPDLPIVVGDASAVVIGPEANIRPLAELVVGLDSVAYATNNIIKVFPLEYANARALADIIYVIASIGTNKDENYPYPIEIFPLKYFNATKLADALRHGLGLDPADVFSTNSGQSRPGGVVADKRSNSLIVCVPRAVMPKIKSLVDEVDQPPSNTSNETPVLALSNSVASQITNLVDMLSPGTGAPEEGRSPNPIFIFPATQKKMLIISASPEFSPVIDDLIRVLDVPVEDAVQQSDGLNPDSGLVDPQENSPEDVMKIIREVFPAQGTREERF